MYNTGPFVIKLLQPVKSSQFTCIYILYILNVYHDTYHYTLEEFHTENSSIFLQFSTIFITVVSTLSILTNSWTYSVKH